MARRRVSLLKRLYDCLPDDAGQTLRAAVSLAGRRGVDLYLVGGGVRDLLLGKSQLDLDLVMEGDALSLASDLAAELRARAVTHPRFGTAVVQGERFRLDLAQARTECYLRPGALPSVRPARLIDDLARRDFTINAMALRLGGSGAGELLDPHGGQEDLERRCVRVLHDESFQDDATRILRALRYAGRLGFRLERHTARLLEHSLHYLDRISGARLRHELERIAREERVGGIVRLAGRLRVLEAVHPALVADRRVQRAATRLPELAPSHRDAVLLCLLLASAQSGGAEAAMGRLSLTSRQAGAVGGFLALRGQEAKLARRELRPSEVVQLLAPRPVEAVEAFVLVARRPLAADRARRYLEEWRFVRPRLDGRDIQALGVSRGPQIGAALASLREARLDGRVNTRDEEVALVRTLQAERRLAGVRHG